MPPLFEWQAYRGLSASADSLPTDRLGGFRKIRKRVTTRQSRFSGSIPKPPVRVALPVKLPACLSYAGNLSLVSEFTEADTADTVFAEVSVRSAADLATVVLSGGELLFLLLLVDHGFLCHFFFPPA